MNMESFEARSGQSDDHLVHAVLAGNRDVYAVLVRRYEQQVHAAAWAVVRDHQAAEDAAQETFTKAYNKLRSLRLRGQFGPWILAIARRTATDYARRKKQLIFVATLPDTPSLDPPDEADAALILSALARLPDQEQQVLLLRYFDELPVAEIATRLRSPVGTITKQLSRAVTRLRDRLKESS